MGRSNGVPRNPRINYRFASEEFDFFFQWLVGASTHGGSEVGESFYAASQIEEGDVESWIRAWTALAERDPRLSTGVGSGLRRPTRAGRAVAPLSDREAVHGVVSQRVLHARRHVRVALRRPLGARADGASNDCVVDPRQIACPLLNVVSEQEYAESVSIRAWAERCEREIPHPDARLVVMPQAEGADSHAIGTNLSLMSQVVFDWLDEVLAASEGEAARSAQSPPHTKRSGSVAERT